MSITVEGLSNFEGLSNLFDRNSYKLNIDWITCRINFNSINDFLESFSAAFPDVVLTFRDKGLLFYQKAFYVAECGYASIVFSYNVDESDSLVTSPIYDTIGNPIQVNYGISVQVSGDGCRYLSHIYDNGLLKFMAWLSLYDPHFTRLDFALDILDKYNPVVPLIQLYGLTEMQENAPMYFKGNMHRVDKKGNPIELAHVHFVYDRIVGKKLPNVTIGTRSSVKGQMQLYNKRVEMESGRLSDISEEFFKEYGVTDYWYRLEYRCKNYADDVFKVLMSDGLYHAFVFVVGYFGSFVDAIHDLHNIMRCPVSVSWSQFVDFLCELSDYYDTSLNILYNSGDIVDVNTGEVIVEPVSSIPSDDVPDFVQTPYVDSKLASYKRWVHKNKAMLYAIFLQSTCDSELLSPVFTVGRYDYHVNPRYAKHEFELKYKYKSVYYERRPDYYQSSMDI